MGALVDEKTLGKVLRLKRQAERLAEPLKKAPEPKSLIGRLAHRELERRAGFRYRLLRWVRKKWKEGKA
jgi:hypothetical protein